MQSSPDDVHSGLKWLAENKGFVSLVCGFGSVVTAIVASCIIAVLWADGIVDGMNAQIQHNAARIDILEEIADDLKKTTKIIGDEQLRRTAPVSEIKGLAEMMKSMEKQLRRIEEK